MGSGLLMAWYGRSPEALLKTWDMAKSLFEDEAKPDDLAMSQTQPFSRKSKVKAQISAEIQPYSHRLAWLVTHGPDNGVDWKNVSKETQELRGAFGLELDLLGNDSAEGEEPDAFDHGPHAADSKDSSPTETDAHGASLAKADSKEENTPSAKAEGVDPRQQAKDFLKEGMEVRQTKPLFVLSA